MKIEAKVVKRQFIVWSFLCIWSGTWGLSAVWAAGGQRGRDKATTCTACHGVEGRSANDEWPNLAGQKATYLVQQIKSFRDGRRYSPLMTPVAKMLDDDDIRDLAAYFSEVKACSQ